ncbi:hypothetical protein [Pseudarthrobacter sp. NKDBFgelt]|uniref:hypothetical protein n=1 Tax=Pseudarthrobacter sp. NKDBFgelt TaxID=3384443 RepID=UPI0038D3A6BD
MTYWWANQKDNYPEAISEGSLWTCPRPWGKALDPGRAYIKEIREGDVVFHYHNKCVRAVSTVIHSFVEYPRTAAYKAREGEGDTGWLVRVKPVRKNLDLHFSQVAELIKIGMPGPLNKSDPPIPQQGKYISLLTDEDGQRLLEKLSLELPVADEGILGRSNDYWDGDETDSAVITKLRKEQAELRKALLGGRDAAPCAVCGKVLPKRLLIAGHIKPRSKCSDKERRNYREIAMLVCALGCDSLFEWGYILVDETGDIVRGRSADTPDLLQAVNLVIGQKCSAFSLGTAAAFAEHMRMNAP